MDDLKKQKKDSAGSTAYGQVEDKAEVKKYPDSIVNTATSQLDAYYRYTAKQYGFDDFNTFLTQSGMTEDTYNVELKKSSAERCQNPASDRGDCRKRRYHGYR